MTIRITKKQDLAAILEMARAMVDYHHELDPYYKPSSALADLESHAEEWLEDPNMILIVAENSGKIVGYFRCATEEAPFYSKAKKIGTVADVFVAREYRRKGAASQMFEKALEWFKKKKVQNIELNVDFRNTGAIAVWKKMGFFEYKLRMRKDLD
ncbi:MAG: GNAT family N-acetyltransferase [Patescibacteria group bacterium]